MSLRPRGADTDVFLTALFPDVTPVLPVRPVGHQAQSLAIALRSPATKRSSDLNRYSPHIHSRAGFWSHR